MRGLTAAMITSQQFERGLRLDQYIATLTQNKENFRANFIRATEAFTGEDMAFFRGLPGTVYVAVLTDDGNPDAVRDVPLISRLSVEAGKLVLRLFRVQSHPDIAAALERERLKPDAAFVGDGGLPVVAFLGHEMRLIGAQAGRLPEVSGEMRRRHESWAQMHPEVRDARERLERMSPITRTRVMQALYALTPEERVAWGQRAVRAWREILGARQ